MCATCTLGSVGSPHDCGAAPVALFAVRLFLKHKDDAPKVNTDSSAIRDKAGLHAYVAKVSFGGPRGPRAILSGLHSYRSHWSSYVGEL